MLRKLFPQNRDFIRTRDARGEDTAPSNLVLGLTPSGSLPGRRIKRLEERLNLRVGLLDKGENAEALELLALTGERSLRGGWLRLPRERATAARAASAELLVDGTLLGRIHHLAVTDDRPWDAEGIEVTGVEAEALIAAYVEEDDILRAGSVAIRRPVQPLLQNADLGPALAEDDSRGEEQATRIGGSEQQLPQLALLLPRGTIT